jgi:hypothetical protein
MDSSDPDAKNFHDRYTSPEMAAWTQMYHFGSAILIPARVNDSPPSYSWWQLLASIMS